jgi:hypothetical protein
MLTTDTYGSTDQIYVASRAADALQEPGSRFWTPMQPHRDGTMIPAALEDDGTPSRAKTELANDTARALRAGKIVSWTVWPGQQHFYHVALVMGAAPAADAATVAMPPPWSCRQVSVHSFEDSGAQYSRALPPGAALKKLVQFIRTHADGITNDIVVSPAPIPKNTTTFQQVTPVCCFATALHIMLRARPSIDRTHAARGLHASAMQDHLRWEMAAGVAALISEQQPDVMEVEQVVAAPEAAAAAEPAAAEAAMDVEPGPSDEGQGQGAAAAAAPAQAATTATAAAGAAKQRKPQRRSAEHQRGEDGATNRKQSEGKRASKKKKQN